MVRNFLARMELNEKRILIVKQSSLGDVIHTFPLVHALKRRYPTVFIGWVVERGFALLVGRDSSVNAVYPIHIPSTSDPQANKWAYLHAFSATLATLRRLRRQFLPQPYDMVLDLHASFRSGLLGLTNPGGIRVGFSDAREGNTWFQHRLVDNNDGHEHAIAKNLLFCKLFDCKAEAGDFYLCSSPGDHAQVEHFLKEVGIDPNDQVIYMNPTARWQSKFWLAPRWGELCDQLLEVGVHPVFGGSEVDLPYISEITRSMAGKAVVAAGRLNLTQSVALMKRAAVYVGLDTGPMHIAAMTGTPVVALFGPTHPERVGPYGVKNAVIQAENLDCLCCRKRACDHQSCMRGIAVSTVYDRVMAFMEPVAAQ
jgi:ADP-heptose:LPS heptosyltransferase